MHLNENIICGCGKESQTALKCSGATCQEFICPECMIQTPTAPKCRKCANLQVNPIFNPTKKELAICVVLSLTFSILFSLGFNVLLKTALNFISPAFGYFVVLIPTALLGLLIGFITEKASHYKRSRKLQLINSIAVLAGHVLIWRGFMYINPILLILSLILGIYLSISRVRP